MAVEIGTLELISNFLIKVFTINLAFMLATIMEKEVVETKSSFLAWQVVGIWLNNGFFYYNYSR